MATWRPARGRFDQCPALISWARSRIRRRSVRSRSATSMKSRPTSEITGAIMIARRPRRSFPDRPLKTRVDELSSDDGRDRQVSQGVELGKPGPDLGIIAQPEDEVSAGRRLEPEAGRLEDQRRLILELDRQPVGQSHVWP